MKLGNSHVKVRCSLIGERTLESPAGADTSKCRPLSSSSSQTPPECVPGGWMWPTPTHNPLKLLPQRNDLMPMITWWADHKEVSWLDLGCIASRELPRNITQIHLCSVLSIIACKTPKCRLGATPRAHDRQKPVGQGLECKNIPAHFRSATQGHRAGKQRWGLVVAKQG